MSDSLSSIVAIVGLGKIGLPVAVQCASHGRQVIGCDIDARVVSSINAGKAHIHEEPGLETQVPVLVEQGLLSATTDTAAAVSRAGVVIVIVPTMIDDRREINFKAMDAATAAVGQGLQPGTLVVYETTLPVGTTSQRLGRLLALHSGLEPGRDFQLAFSPERVASGHILRDLATYPKVVGGIDERSTEVAVAFYRSVLDVPIITMASTEDAEFVKLIESVYRDVNIALANEFARYADARGLNLAAATKAANSEPLSHIHNPGIGVGGHCIPVYPYFLFDEAEASELTTLRLTRAARQINDSMPDYAVRRIEALLGSLSGRLILILGVTYRGNVRETAFSSAILLHEALVERGARVFVNDPLYSDEELQAQGYTPLPDCEAEHVQAIVLQAEHRGYQELDFAQFGRCKVVLDGRAALKREKIQEIEALGMRYLTIGDGSSPARIESFDAGALYSG